MIEFIERGDLIEVVQDIHREIEGQGWTINLDFRSGTVLRVQYVSDSLDMYAVIVRDANTLSEIIKVWLEKDKVRLFEKGVH